MFGFGKKKVDEDRLRRALAGIALEAIHNTQKEVLDDFSKFLEANENCSKDYGTCMYFLMKVYFFEAFSKICLVLSDDLSFTIIISSLFNE